MRLIWLMACSALIFLDACAATGCGNAGTAVGGSWTCPPGRPQRRWHTRPNCPAWPHCTGMGGCHSMHHAPLHALFSAGKRIGMFFVLPRSAARSSVLYLMLLLRVRSLRRPT